jgi:hypothetical protein
MLPVMTRCPPPCLSIHPIGALHPFIHAYHSPDCQCCDLAVRSTALPPMPMSAFPFLSFLLFCLCLLSFRGPASCRIKLPAGWQPAVFQSSWTPSRPHPIPSPSPHTQHNTCIRSSYQDWHTLETRLITTYMTHPYDKPELDGVHPIRHDSARASRWNMQRPCMRVHVRPCIQAIFAVTAR